MLILILGVALWWAAHLFKRIAPGVREPMGDKGKGVVALALVVESQDAWLAVPPVAVT